VASAQHASLAASVTGGHRLASSTIAVAGTAEGLQRRPALWRLMADVMAIVGLPVRIDLMLAIRCTAPASSVDRANTLWRLIMCLYVSSAAARKSIYICAYVIVSAP